MATLNTPEKVIQNLLAIVVVAIVFYWVWASMQENKFKAAIRSGIDRIKEMFRGG